MFPANMEGLKPDLNPEATYIHTLTYVAPVDASAYGPGKTVPLAETKAGSTQEHRNRLE